MSRVPYKFTAVRADDDDSGKNVVPYASVNAKDEVGAPANIYTVQTGGSPSSSFILDANGEKQIWVDPGIYQFSVAGGPYFSVFASSATTEDFTIAEKTKLAGIASGATANDTNAQLRDRTTHTGFQAVSTITGLQSSLDSKATSAQFSAIEIELDTKLDKISVKSSLSSPNTSDAASTFAVADALANANKGQSYKGLWNSITNTPTIVSSTGNTGDFYEVSVPSDGVTTIDGIDEWPEGSKIIFNGSIWEKNTAPGVRSVDGRTGAVVLNYDTPAQAALASLSVGVKFSTKGASAIGDGGNGDFIVSPTPPAVLDYFSGYALASGNFAILQPVNGSADSRQFSDGDDTASIQRLFNYCSAQGAAANVSKDYTVGDIVIPKGLHFSGTGTISGVVTGSAPTGVALSGAIDNSARSVLMDAHWQSVATFSGSGSIYGTPRFKDILFRSGGSIVLAQGDAGFDACGFDSTVITASASNINAPSIVITNGGAEIAMQADYGGSIYSPDVVVTNSYRAGRIRYGGGIQAERCRVYSLTNAGFYILFDGSVNCKDGVINGCTVGGLINNYGGHFNAENVAISNCTSGVAVIIESNGSCFLQGATLDNNQNAIAVALGGFIQARYVTITNTAFVCVNAINDGFIECGSIKIDSTNTNSVLVAAKGAGRISIGQPGVDAGVLTLAPSKFSPAWGTVGQGNALISDFYASSPVGLQTIVTGGTGATTRSGALSSLGFSATYTINDDSVRQIAFGTSVSNGLFAISSNASAVGKGLYGFRAASGPFMTAIAVSGTLDSSIAVLTGTTGVDGRVTVSAVDGSLYIENRSGGALVFTVLILQHQAAVSII